MNGPSYFKMAMQANSVETPTLRISNQTIAFFCNCLMPTTTNLISNVSSALHNRQVYSFQPIPSAFLDLPSYTSHHPIWSTHNHSTLWPSSWDFFHELGTRLSPYQCRWTVQTLNWFNLFHGRTFLGHFNFDQLDGKITPTIFILSILSPRFRVDCQGIHIFPILC